MSKISINQYYNNVDRAVQFGKSKNEQTIRNYFWNLLNDYARKLNYEVKFSVWETWEKMFGQTVLLKIPLG